LEHFDEVRSEGVNEFPLVGKLVEVESEADRIWIFEEAKTESMFHELVVEKKVAVFLLVGSECGTHPRVLTKHDSHSKIPSKGLVKKSCHELLVS